MARKPPSPRSGILEFLQEFRDFCKAHKIKPAYIKEQTGYTGADRLLRGVFGNLSHDSEYLLREFLNEEKARRKIEEINEAEPVTPVEISDEEADTVLDDAWPETLPEAAPQQPTPAVVDAATLQVENYRLVAENTALKGKLAAAYAELSIAYTP